MQCKVCYHFNCIWVCYHLSAQLSACNRFQCYIQCKCVITSTVYGCVTCSLKCVITSTVYELYNINSVYGVVITYELNCQRLTAFSVTCSVKCVITSTVYELYMGVLSLMSSTVSVLPLSVLHAV